MTEEVNTEIVESPQVKVSPFRGGNHGIPFKMKPETVKIILDDLLKGRTKTSAATHAGITRETLYAWMEKYPEFKLAVEKAQVEPKDVVADGLYDQILNDPNCPWQLKCWWLERNFPEEYALRNRQNESLLSVSVNGPAQLAIECVTNEEKD